MAGRILASLLIAVSLTATAAADDNSPLDLFEQRIMPIFKSPKPSSCVQCHLASVDLKDYILPSHEQTFASLNAQGLVDLENPEASKILKLIAMGDRDRDAKAKRIHEKMRRAEYEAFAAWIKACCADPNLRSLTATAKVAKPAHPDAVIRHARKSRIVDSFVRKVWSQRMRCFPCHTPHELDENNPKHKVPLKKVREFEAKYGKQYAERLRIFRETPEATLQYLIADSRNTPSDRLPLLDLEQPTKSLLLLKPTAKLPARRANKQFEPPTYLEPISHMGGLKLHVDDPGYKSFVSFIQDYANIVSGKYVDVDSLPADNWAPTKQFLMVSEAPKAWAPGVPVQLFVHGWNSNDKTWTEEAVAFTQNTTTPRGRLVAPLMLLRSEANDEYFAEGESSEPRLKAGRYLLKVYLDQAGKLKKDPSKMLEASDFVGQLAVNAAWQEGFPKREKISAAAMTARAESQ